MDSNNKRYQIAINTNCFCEADRGWLIGILECHSVIKEKIVVSQSGSGKDISIYLFTKDENEVGKLTDRIEKYFACYSECEITVWIEQTRRSKK